MLVGLLLIVQIIVAIGLTAVILLQRSEGGALGMGGGPSGFMTARGAGDLLTRTTGILATIFFILSIALTVVVGKERGASSVVDRLKVDALNPDALNKSVPPAAPANQAAPAPAPQGGLFQVPTPQVQGAPPATPTPPPGATQDSGADAAASRILGVQTAPQAPQPTAPQPQAPAQ
jgi:preprotein translocase subunit SecG